MKIYSRSEWGASRKDGDGTYLSGPAEFVLHHTVTNISANASVAQEKAHMRMLERVVNGRWGSGIGYNWIVFPSGRVYEGVSYNRRGTHTGGRNSTLMAISLVGNYENKKPTAAMENSVAELMNFVVDKGWRATKAQLAGGHRDYSQTACPGTNAYKRIPTINKKAEENEMPLDQNDLDAMSHAVWSRINPNMGRSYSWLLRSIIAKIDKQDVIIENLVKVIADMPGGEAIDQEEFMAEIRQTIDEKLGEPLEFDVTINPKEKE